jgi:hypothetical protein
MSSLSSRLSKAGVFVLSVAAMGACGSRTGLFGEDPLVTSLDGSLRDGALDGPPDGAIPCTPGRFDFVLATAQLMFVVDRSGSMAFALDGTRPNEQTGQLPPGLVSRWDTLRDALFQTITPFDNALAMGAKFYPEEIFDPQSEDQCRTETGVGIPPARNNVSTILDVFDSTVPRGGTPTAEALRLAAEYLGSTRTVARTIILATDGAPNCNDSLDNRTCVCTSVDPCNDPQRGSSQNCLDDTRAVNVVRNIFEAQKIPVYVIGIGGSESPNFISVLDQLAVAGGRPRPTTPKHYNVQSAAELKASLQSIGDSIAKCTYLTPSAPTDPNAISVEVGGKPINRDVTHTNGWDWVDQAFGTLAFFGPSCDAASSGTPAITGVVSCKNP